MIWIALVCFVMAFLVRNSLWSGPLVASGFVLAVVWLAQPAHSAQRNDWRYVTWQYPDKPGRAFGMKTKAACEASRKMNKRIPTSPCYQEMK